MTFHERASREDEHDRVRGFLRDEANESDARIRGAFHAAASGLLEWQDPSEQLTAREYRRLEGITGNGIYRPEGKETHYGRDEYVDPFNLDEDEREWDR